MMNNLLMENNNQNEEEIKLIDLSEMEHDTGGIADIGYKVLEYLAPVVNKRINQLFSKYNEFVKTAQDEAVEARKKAEKAVAINDFGRDYLNQTELGKLYKPRMSSITIGQVLRLIGWAKVSKKSDTEPYNNLDLRAKRVYANQYHYNKEKFKEDFENWLKENGLWEEFDNHISRKQRQQFIKELHEARIEWIEWGLSPTFKAIECYCFIN